MREAMKTLLSPLSVRAVASLFRMNLRSMGLVPLRKQRQLSQCGCRQVVLSELSALSKKLSAAWPYLLLS